jgi:uncharacterized protein
MSEQLPTPSPKSNSETAPFWDALGEGRLQLPVCDLCHEAIWYPRLFCPNCGSEDVSWVASPARGTVYSFTVVERGQGRWADHAPYVLAYVELEEGPRILTNIVGGAPDDVSIGAAVHAHFDHASDDENGGGAILRFVLS